jgi:DNA-binding transcriptional ArsR family regulator
MEKTMQRSPAQFREQAKVMKPLTHPTRMFIVDEPSRGERCVCELTEMIGAEMPTVSRHLSQLKSVGLVDDDKRGAKIFYPAAGAVLPELPEVRGVGPEVLEIGI